MISDWIGTWNVEDLEKWYVQANGLFAHKVESHTFICFSADKPPYVYKNLNMIHKLTLQDLPSKFPNCFYLIVLSKSILEWSKVKTQNKIFPINSLENNNEIPNVFIEYTNKKLVFDIETLHYSDKITFTCNDIRNENLYQSKKEKIIVDFENKNLISSIIDGERIYNHHLLMGQ